MSAAGQDCRVGRRRYAFPFQTRILSFQGEPFRFDSPAQANSPQSRMVGFACTRRQGTSRAEAVILPIALREITRVLRG
jgi:hypothetical protein